MKHIYNYVSCDLTFVTRDSKSSSARTLFLTLHQDWHEHCVEAVTNLQGACAHLREFWEAALD